MRLTRVCFVGTRTEHFEETVRLFRDVLGMSARFENPGWSGFRLATGERDFVEVFSDADHDERLFPPRPAQVPRRVRCRRPHRRPRRARRSLRRDHRGPCLGRRALRRPGFCGLNFYVLQQDGEDATEDATSSSTVLLAPPAC